MTPLGAQRSAPPRSIRMTCPLPRSPASQSAQHQLEHNRPIFRDFSVAYALQAFHYGSDILAVLTKRLGPCTSVLDFEGRAWSAWASNAYTLYAIDTYLDLDTTVRGLEGSLTALQWDLGSRDHLLPRLEHEALVEQGRTEGLKVKHEYGCQPQEQLKQFVRDYCDGRAFCDHQVRDQSILGMVFMPLAFGALSLKAPEEGHEPDRAYLAQQSLTKNIGKEPKAKDPPPPPEKPPYPMEPPKPEDWREPDPEQVRIIKDDIAWDVASPERLENYLEEIRLHNVGVDYHRQQVLIDWEAQKATIDLAHEHALVEHAKAIQAKARADRGILTRHKAWSLRQARQNAILSGFHLGRLSDIGLIYEDLGKAGPRSINGYPIFWSFCILNKSDWERARKAIASELKRREDMEV